MVLDNSRRGNVDPGHRVISGFPQATLSDLFTSTLHVMRWVVSRQANCSINQCTIQITGLPWKPINEVIHMPEKELREDEPTTFETDLESPDETESDRPEQERKDVKEALDEDE